MDNFNVHSIGKVKVNEGGYFIELKEEYIPALKAIEGFSHLNLIWWFSDFDSDEFREELVTSKPYKQSPEEMGMFATRSPIRPNPIALTVIQIIFIDYENGVIEVGYLDANDGSPVLDIKPYTPSLDRVEEPEVPQWCSHWPDSLEKSAYFDWSKEFNFE